MRTLAAPFAALLVAALSAPSLAQQADPLFWSANGTVRATVLVGDTLYVGGVFSYVGPNSGGLALVNATTGDPVAGFPAVTGTVYCAESDGAGGWYVGGLFTAVGGVSRSNLAHILSDMSVSAWDPGADQVVQSLAANGSTVYVGGQFTSVGGQSRSRIAALDATTGEATAWNPGADQSVIVLRVSGSYVYAGGEFLNIGGQARARVAQLDTLTGAATSWNPGNSFTTNYVLDLRVRGSLVYVAGGFSFMGGALRNNIAAVSAASGLATGWDPNANGEVGALAVTGSTIYAGGNFTSIGGQLRTYLAALDSATATATGWNANVNSSVTEILVSGSTVYVGGLFTLLGGSSWQSLVALDAATGLRTASWTGAANQMVRTFVLDETNLLVGGDFTSGGGKMRAGLAALDVATGAATDWNPGASGGPVLALAARDGIVYVGGNFTTLGGSSRARIGAVEAATGTATSWNPGASATVFALAVDDAAVYVGGAFSTIGGGTLRNRIAALHLFPPGNAIPGWNPSANLTVRTLLVNGTSLYAGGDFSTIGGQPRSRLAELSVFNGNPTGWNPNVDVDGHVSALAIGGSMLYAGGTFTTVGGQPRNHIAAVDTYTGLPSSWDPYANGEVAALAVRGRRVYAAGQFGTWLGSPTIGGADREYIAALDVETGLATAWDPAASSFVHALSLGATTLHAGGDFLTVGGASAPNLAAISIPTHPLGGFVYGSGSVSRQPNQASYVDGSTVTLTALPAPGWGFARWDGDISPETANPLVIAMDTDRWINATFVNSLTVLDVEPAQGGSDGGVSAVVSGVGLVPGASVRLALTGQPDIPGSGVVVAGDSLSLAATFDLTGAAAGAWDVIVTNPSLSEDTLPGAFTVESSTPRQLMVDLLGPALVRPDRSKAFDVVIENLGNSDLANVPLWLSRIPADATVEPDFAVAPPPQEGGEPDWSAAPLTFDGPAGRYAAIVIPRLPPGVTVRRFYVSVPNTVTSFELDAAVTPPWEGPLFEGCLDGAGIVTAPACATAQLDAINAYLAATPEIEALSGPGLWAKIAWQCEGSASLPAALAKAEEVLDTLLQPVEGTAVPTGCEVALVPRWQARLVVTVVTSVDPNDKLGSVGVGTERLIGTDQLMPYSIRFENLESATAPAQEVVVLDLLDTVTLDPTTVSLGPITFGTRVVSPPPGLSNYTTDLDLRPEQDLIVRIAVSLDAPTGLLAWSLTSIDPETGALPDDPLAGFLPPNVTPPEGEGSVLFTVMPRSGLLDGTAIRNRAVLYFDGSPLLTPEWANLLDITPPESEVLPLLANQDSVSFTVQWASVGAPPDLRDYSVYVSEDGGDYRPWRVHTTATADTIVAPGGRTYSFYSLARDSSGNLEPVPGAPDVQTFSRVAVEGGAPLRLTLEGARPNPSGGEARVWFTLPSRERATLEVVDVAGRRVMRREVGALGPGRHAVDVGAATRAPGLYFVRLAQGGRSLVARMVVIR